MTTFAKFKQFFIGRPLATRQIISEKLSNVEGLAIFSADALSSTAYATEEILWVLMAGGIAAFVFSIPIALAISALIMIVVISYRQTIHAYPQGGGAYTVAKANLGEYSGLVAASSLLIDYILTAAVSVAAGIAAITSAFPALYPWRVALAIGAIMFLAWGNLRGVKESGKLFAIPTYFFLAASFGLIAYGFWRVMQGTLPVLSEAHALTAISSLGILLILRAFSSGCTAMTGIEATSNGVQAFKEPVVENASKTLAVMAGILVFIFLGVTFLSYQMHVVPRLEETVISQVAESLFGRNIFYFLIQFATALILLLAANTPFAGFPRVTSILAKDNFLPRQFQQLGSRLIYANGVFILALLSIGILVFFRADTHNIIPLYAVGVFLGFTLSQLGMVRHWMRDISGKKHRFSIFINAFGGLLTLVVFVITFVFKFEHGAWILVPAVSFLVLFMRAVRRHYLSVENQLALENPIPAIPKKKTVVVLVSGIHVGTLKAVEFAKTLHAAHVRAVHIATDETAEESEAVKQHWLSHVSDVHLDIIPSPYRELTGPLIQYIQEIEKRWDDDTVIVVIPEFVPTKFWHHWLHNQTAMQIRWALEHIQDVEIVDVPYRLK